MNEVPKPISELPGAVQSRNPLGYGTELQAEEPQPTKRDFREQERFLKLAEVRQRLGVSRTTLWRWSVERGLKVVTIGGVTRVRESELQTFLASHELTVLSDVKPRRRK